MIRHQILAFVSILSCFLSLSLTANATTYFISPSGNDANSGTAVSSAWRTIDKVNLTLLQPGDKVLFEAEQTFYGALDSRSSGKADQPIVFSTYGKGYATINSGDDCGFVAYNTDAIEIRRLKFVGDARNINRKAGIIFYRDASTSTATQLQHIILDSLEVSGYQACGITIGSYNTDVDFWGTPYGYDNVRITNTLVHDNGDTGIFSYGATLHAHRNWYIANCKSYNNSGLSYVTDRNTGSGIVLANIDEAVVEHCKTYNNGWRSSHKFTGPAGIWAYSCNNLTIQFSESYHNQSATLDGGGFDLDGGCTNALLQYNYSHDNDGPGLMLAQFEGAPVTLRDVVIRYNISQNDSRRYAGAITLWSSGANGGIQRANVYNNTVYLSPTASGYIPQAVYISSAYMETTAVRNNIFQTTAGIPFLLDLGPGEVIFQGNCYWSSGAKPSWKQGGITHTSLESWRKATGAERLHGTNSGLEVNPRLVSPEKIATVPVALNERDGALTALQLQDDSPLRDAGLDLQSLFGIPPGPYDFFGFPTPQPGTSGSVGANERGTSPRLPIELTNFQAKSQANIVSLRWATAEEIHIAYFEIQRSVDGQSFANVKRVTAAGKSSRPRSYQWTDPQRTTQATYYRLRQVNQDGTSRNSHVVIVVPSPAKVPLVSQAPSNLNHKNARFLQLSDLAG
ncbi:right-handed parallel beta-helix repeat-containing protein [Hymenobacter wooponensis]|uniref:Right handed beta helix domain-containing protein n=1 Tax=Hymenobacter wooponensis TaxID=1525360 RepID=A0A4Z0MT66_9BACT|nr:right-handed parallel beta-helix repeat-containing protein [Hymenobacter wooponensis]TGD82437.1 hypothetical protein EU557_01210 [Hymenobacter wooponensis]